eukprot:scaffold553819_cov13-Prasinocladus_malaysianus.AAC.1
MIGQLGVSPADKLSKSAVLHGWQRSAYYYNWLVESHHIEPKIPGWSDACIRRPPDQNRTYVSFS